MAGPRRLRTGLPEAPFVICRAPKLRRGFARSQGGAAAGPGLYHIEDGSGSLPVVNREGRAPRSGARVVVKGKFRAAFTLGDRSLAVLVEESRSQP